MNLDEPAAAPRTISTPLSARYGEDWVVFEHQAGPQLPLAHAAPLAERVRRALSAHARAALDPEGVLVVPLPERPDPAAPVAGVAVIFARALPSRARQAAMDAILRWEATRRLGLRRGEPPAMGVVVNGAEVRLKRVAYGVPRQACLHSWTWCRPSTMWGARLEASNVGGEVGLKERILRGSFEDGQRPQARLTAFRRPGAPVMLEIGLEVRVPVRGPLVLVEGLRLLEPA
ncbi:MAG: hypothetical protein H6730_21200 [Deltaproteobacteria bacterium]|nr:hypothetical protein [Deltaproteobacteria bacterium]